MADSTARIDPGVTVGHVHLKVSDLERAIRFYRDVLGFEVTQRLGDSAAFLSAGGYVDVWQVFPTVNGCNLITLSWSAQPGAEFGASLEMDGLRLAIGSPGWPDVGGVGDLGRVDLYQWNAAHGLTGSPGRP